MLTRSEINTMPLTQFVKITVETMAIKQGHTQFKFTSLENNDCNGRTEDDEEDNKDNTNDNDNKDSNDDCHNNNNCKTPNRVHADEESDNEESNPARIAPARIREDRECNRNLGQTIRELEKDPMNDEALGVAPN